MQKKSTRSVSDVFAILVFYCTTGLLSAIVVPVLATIAYGFGFCTVLIFIAGIIRSFGVVWIKMDIGPGLSIPQEWSMVLALIIGGIVGSIAYFSWKYLRIYLNFLSRSYRKVLPVNKQ
ncbi:MULTISPECIES: hypothetical protein [Bacillus]|uniref:Uncharacterized protein n=1 Tax=Bacillus pseudomycoides TaxID=64104 RepID=A0AAJ3R9V0_9BACI|nr:hypothetical protein [Bacillus pseudomycoides]KFN16375.1 putative membrane protein [Bacillus pseudomycoides]MBD5795352.1 hypothetical protein [Bacillus pseudomycoides]MCR8857728.1 hypothetical protein [Bacillus pseudomycoides]MDR4186599.1 hypothetical protein [Bacillus pseudomycoides]MDR4325378.1 hypothetical protein [Bacillus pseudomycoides]